MDMETTIVKIPATQAISPMVLVFGAFTAEFSLVAVFTEATEVEDICYYTVFVRR